VADYAEQIVRGLQSGVLALDQSARVLIANLAACRHLGLEPDTLELGKKLSEVPAAEPFIDVFTKIKETNEPQSRLEVIITHDDGTKKEIGLSASPLEGADAFTGAIFLFTDMTERRMLERAAEINRQLAQLGELTAGVVHELRNPVGVISGMAELLERRILTDDADAQRYIAAILQETKQMEQSLSQFLGFARPFDIAPEPCRPEDIIDRALQFCEPKTRAKDIALAHACDPDLPQLEADVGRAAQALANLLNNAADAVDEGGSITLTVQRQGPYIVFAVDDDGPGLDLAGSEDILSPFFTKKESGTGLGLSIVHRIVTAHGGAVAYHNHPESGAHFEIRLPIKKGALW
jgi:two-component system, NtrC family, sensor histidine kinase HydH